MSFCFVTMSHFCITRKDEWCIRYYSILMLAY